MPRSSIAARLITAVVGLIAAPIAVGLISQSGLAIYRLITQYIYVGIPIGLLLPTLPVMLAGLVLLAVVAFTARWSSAGLLAVGVLGIIALIMQAAPPLLIEYYRAMHDVLPTTWLDGMYYGLPLAVFLTLGAMGLAVLLVRRAGGQTSQGGAAVAGMITAPVLLAIGGALLLWSISQIFETALIRYDFRPLPLAAIGLVFGAIATVAGIVATRWARWALLLPAAALVVLSIVVYVAPLVPIIFIMRLPSGIAAFFYMGGGIAVAVAMIAFTIALGRLARPTSPIGFVPPAPGTVMPPYAGGPLSPGNPYV